MLLLALCGLVAAPGGAAADSRCPRVGTTIASNADARVWRIRPGSRIDRHYGCAHRRGRVFRLDPPRGQVSAPGLTLVLAGRAVAYQTLDFDLRPYRVVVRSLHSGRMLHSAPANFQGSADGHTGPVVGMVAKRNGSVAWMASVDCVCEEVDHSVNGWELHVMSRANRHVELDSGPLVDPTSLRLSSARGAITWKHGDETRRVPLR